MPNLQRLNFNGGINQLVDPAKIDITQYYLLINGRNRRNRITPINQPLEYDLPVVGGKVQGVYAFNTFLLALISGKIYYKPADSATSAWTLISAISFDPNVDRIYVEAVPANSFKFSRTVVSTATAELSLAGPIASSPFAAVIMDGISQPGLVFADGSARLAKNYAQWTKADPEYVPIGIMPLRVGPVLYCVVKDVHGRFTQIVRSVSGQPVNFVIQVTPAGEKVDINEGVGGALAMATYVDFNPLTALRAINAFPGSFLAGTNAATYLVTPDFNQPLRYGEPQFKQQPLFSIGPVNNYAVSDMLGDTAIIFPFGVTTFNAVTAASFAGKNTPFSAAIQDIIGDIVQTDVASISYNNYSVFAIQTRYGSAVLWYDQITQQWVAVDILEDVGSIKQFAVQQITTGFALFFYDSNNKIFKYFGGPVSGNTRIYFNEIFPTKSAMLHALDDLTIQFTGSTIDFNIEVGLYIDRNLVSTKGAAGKASMPAGYLSSPELPLQEPIIGEVGVNPAFFNFKSESVNGFRIGIDLAWTGDAELLVLEANTTEMENHPAPETIHFTPINPITLVFVGGQATNTANKLDIVAAVKAIKPDFIVDTGNVSLTSDVSLSNAIDLYIKPSWDYLHGKGKYFGVAGTSDNAFNLAENLYQYLRQAPPHYSVISLGPNAEIYLLSAGITALDYNQIEPDNYAGPGPTDGIYRGPQYTWLRDKLATSIKSTKIVVWSFPQYSSQSGSAQLLAARAASLAMNFKSLGASCVVCGEIGGFEHITNNGFNWFNTMGCVANTIPAVLQSYTKQFSPEAGFLKATIYNLSILWEYISTTGEVLYRFRQTY